MRDFLSPPPLQCDKFSFQLYYNTMRPCFPSLAFPASVARNRNLRGPNWNWSGSNEILMVVYTRMKVAKRSENAALWFPKRAGVFQEILLQDPQSLKIAKKSHSILRAKRATFIFWMENTSMSKMVNLGSFENLQLVVKQCYQIGQF